MSDLRSEAFIPYEQIEPLLIEGMTANELKRALCRATGLDPETYIFVTQEHTGDPSRMSLAECIRGGLFIERRGRPQGEVPYIPFPLTDKIATPPSVGHDADGAAPRAPLKAQHSRGGADGR